MNSIDLIKNIKWVVESTGTTQEKIYTIEAEIRKYEATLADEVIKLETLTRERSDDAMLNHIGLKYGVTINQVVGLMDLSEQMNRGICDGTGVVVVPFWFNSQYQEALEQNKELNKESESLIATVQKIKSLGAGDLQTHVDNIKLPERTNIITGNARPYIPGQTGPRPGDEALDEDNKYLVT